MPQRTLIISDTHFGDTIKTAGPVERFTSLIKETDQLIINGDGFEFEPAKAKPAAMAALDAITTLCLQNSVQFTTLAGNHDPHDAWPRQLKFASGRILLSHGDAFHPGISPWCSVARQLANAYAAAVADLASQGMPDTLDTRLLAAHIANKAEWRREHPPAHAPKPTTILNLAKSPHRIIRLAHYWSIIPRMASQFAQRYAPESRIVLFGHTHHEGIWRRQGRWVINTGAYRFPGRPLACTLQHNTLKVHRLNLLNNQYVLAPKPLIHLNLDSI